MIGLSRGLSVFAFTDAVDMRKSFCRRRRWVSRALQIHGVVRSLCKLASGSDRPFILPMSKSYTVVTAPPIAFSFFSFSASIGSAP